MILFENNVRESLGYTEEQYSNFLSIYQFSKKFAKNITYSKEREYKYFLLETFFSLCKFKDTKVFLISTLFFHTVDDTCAVNYKPETIASLYVVYEQLLQKGLVTFTEYKKLCSILQLLDIDSVSDVVHSDLILANDLNIFKELLYYCFPSMLNGDVLYYYSNINTVQIQSLEKNNNDDSDKKIKFLKFLYRKIDIFNYQPLRDSFILRYQDLHAYWTNNKYKK